MALLKKYMTAFEVFACVVLALCAFIGGYHLKSLSAQRDQSAAIAAQVAADAQELQRQIHQTQTNAATAQASAVATAEAKQKTAIEYRTITQQVTKYVETHPDLDACRTDDDGLRIWREANAGQSVQLDAGQH